MAYTAIVTPDSLKTHVYAGIIDEIVESDSSIIVSAIAQAIAEARLYLTRYDLTAIFGDPATNTAATFPPDDMLLNIIKIIAVWNLMNLARPNLDYEAWKTRYGQMISTLKDIQAGRADPRWPYQEYQGVTTPDSIEVTVHANQKQINDY